MGTSNSHPPKLQRSLSLKSSQRSSFLEFHMRLFKIDREICSTPNLTETHISDFKSRLYSLRREFDGRNYKEKYQTEFRIYHSNVVEKLEERMKSDGKKKSKKKKKKMKAPDPPVVIELRIKEFWDDVVKLESQVESFCEGRQSLKYKYLYHSLVVLLIRLDKMETSSEEDELERKKCSDVVLKIMRILEEKVGVKERLETVLED